MELESYGENPICILNDCAGNCNTDADCFPGLFCQQRTNGETVVGCLGEPMSDSYNYCTSFNPANCDPPAVAGVLEIVGDNPTCFLSECQGDCDNDDDCVTGLFCFSRTNGETTPGCTGTPPNDFVDYCVSVNPNP